MTPAELRDQRATLCVTQCELADELGVNVRTVKRWEAGDAPVPRLVAWYLNQLEIESAATVGGRAK
jgi:DNA-binding transcriptional regulator YiaG